KKLHRQAVDIGPAEFVNVLHQKAIGKVLVDMHVQFVAVGIDKADEGGNAETTPRCRACRDALRRWPASRHLSRFKKSAARKTPKRTKPSTKPPCRFAQSSMTNGSHQIR